MNLRLRRSLPSRGELLAGTPAWALAIAVNVAWGLWRQGWQGPPLLHIALLFALGAAIAFPLGVTTARFAAQGRREETVFAAIVLCLAAATVLVIGGLYALAYRHYYAQWHAPAFTHVWALQFFFTTATALYQFATLGLRLLFPLGFAALLAAAVLLAHVEKRGPAC